MCVLSNNCANYLLGAPFEDFANCVSGGRTGTLAESRVEREMEDEGKGS